MKKIKNVIFLSAVLLISLLSASCMISKPNTTEQKNTITVTGTGSTTLKPDIVEVRFLVRNTGWNMLQVSERNATNTTNTINAIKEAGVSASDIYTCDYEITQDNTHSYAGEYTVRNIIVVLISDFDIVQKVIDAAVKNNIGANGVLSFNYLISDKSNALKEARLLAIANAQDAASLLAGATGCKIDSVLEIQESYSTQKTTLDTIYENIYQNSASNAELSPIQNGTITISSNVTIKYELIN